MAVDFAPHGNGRLAERKRKFDGAEPAGGRSPETIEQRTFSKQVSEVGGKTAHRPLFE